MSWNVLLSAPYMVPFADRFVPELQAAGCRVTVAPVEERLEETDLLRLMPEMDGIICGDDRLTRRVIEALPRLKVISKWGTGIDSIDQQACADRGVRLCNTPNAFTTPVADSTLAYVLAFARRSFEMDRAMHAGDWRKIPGRALHECTLGIIGVGNIGCAVARRARAFGMRVLGCDLRSLSPGTLSEFGIEQVDLNVLLEQSDFVTLHCDLNPTSRHLLGREAFGMMKPQAIVLNLARGPCVDESALVEALQAGRIGGAALDVFEVEPLTMSSPLRGMPNVLLAPHNSNSSATAWERVHRSTIDQLLAALRLSP
jgi:D-3-phosphoglycerate dehydrogenase